MQGVEGEAPAVFKDGRTYYLLSSRLDGWLPNQNTYFTASSLFSIPRDLPAREYEIRIALTDEKQKPAIQLGIEGGDGELRYNLGTIRILSSNVP